MSPSVILSRWTHPVARYWRHTSTKMDIQRHVLFVGPQLKSKRTMSCYSVASQCGWNSDGMRSQDVTPLWQTNWSLRFSRNHFVSRVAC